MTNHENAKLKIINVVSYRLKLWNKGSAKVRPIFKIRPNRIFGAPLDSKEDDINYEANEKEKVIKEIEKERGKKFQPWGGK